MDLKRGTPWCLWSFVLMVVVMLVKCEKTDHQHHHHHKVSLTKTAICKAHCVASLMASAMTDTDCIHSTECATCWLTCEYLVNRPRDHAFICGPDYRIFCLRGCHTACDVIKRHKRQDVISADYNKWSFPTMAEVEMIGRNTLWGIRPRQWHWSDDYLRHHAEVIAWRLLASFTQYHRITGCCERGRGSSRRRLLQDSGCYKRWIAGWHGCYIFTVRSSITTSVCEVYSRSHDWSTTRTRCILNKWISHFEGYYWTSDIFVSWRCLRHRRFPRDIEESCWSETRFVCTTLLPVVDRLLAAT